MSIPADRRYSEAHLRARAEGNGAVTIGIIHHAQDLLGDLVLVESPAMGRKLKTGEHCGMVESVKSASDIYTTISGEVSAVNGGIETAGKINQNA
jgi:glycine cleavage system H protein